MTQPRQIVVGTAGHIDHGKSLMVRVLTGTDPDRLKEEKERGITIDLGFAEMILEDGTRVGFVDVPGHERFVRNMLAGISGIDLLLMVVAGDESIKPQTREHFDICRLLRVPEGVLVITKTDLAEPDLLDLVKLEVREFVQGSFLESAPLVAVDSRTGRGYDALRGAIAEAATRVRQRPVDGLLRLPVDRSFSIKGFGSVVTGTLIAGTLRVGEEVAILPAGRTARVRGLEVFKQATEVALPGQRTAVNLQGVEAGTIQRGDLLTAAGVLEPVRMLDVSLSLLEDSPSALKDLSRVRFHHGTVEAMARVKLLEGGSVPPGSKGFAQLRLERPVAALPGDPFIIRRYSPPLTIGGGRILHNNPRKLRRSAPGAIGRFERLADPDPDTRLRVLIEEGGEKGIDVGTLRARTGLDPRDMERILAGSVRAGDVVALPTTPRRYIAGPEYTDLSARVTGALKAFHRSEPLQGGPSREEIRTRIFSASHQEVFRCLIADLAKRKTIRVDRDRIALAGHRIEITDEESSLMEEIESRFAQAGTNPPELQSVVGSLGGDARRAEKLFRLLLNRGKLVRIQDGRVFHSRAIEDLKHRLWELRDRSPVLEISEFKDLSGTSRKNAIPLLEHFDQIRVTRREGNHRVILPPPGRPSGAD